MEKIKLGLLFGGRSGEHEVSLNSAAAVARLINKEKYEVIPIAIAKDGKWYGPVAIEDISNFTPEKYIHNLVTFLPYPNKNKLINIADNSVVEKIDIVFPVLHGTFGEDGTIQGLLELANIPYIGSGVLGSSAGMDKVAMKDIFSQHNLSQVKYMSVLRSEIETNMKSILEKVSSNLTFPLFIKPANLGSSVGISKAYTSDELRKSLQEAAKYDRKIVIEEGLNAREIEISVLGNDDPKISLPGEIIPCNDFYDYKAKYIDNSSVLKIPAELDEKTILDIQDLARKAFLSLDCAGLARVDFFICKDTGKIYINEINTLPGFTEISMYPKLWAATGISMEDLIDKLVNLGLERHVEKNKNLTSFNL